ncbi:MAG: N-sulfoglucosamine sulfohydrolase [Limisphaerales bacterium]|jgi:N-sulfoglucosamine sulfohydrolase
MNLKSLLLRCATVLVALSFVSTNHAANDRPNILFCIADDASFPHMGAYGTKWVTSPGFDRVAEEGILFTRAYTPNAKCSPSRACILTGRNTWQLEEACNHVPMFPAKFKSYCEALMDNGYTVGKTGKGWAPGVANDKNGKPRLITGVQYETKRKAPPAKSISSNDYAGNFRDFLNKKPISGPWAFWYGATEPHRAYEYGVGVRLGGKKISDIDKVPPFWPDTEKVRNDMLDYAFEIEHFDKHLVRMLALLEERGELDNTLIVVTADNGMPFPRIKGQEYEMSNHLPLAVMWPKGIKNPGRTVSDYVSFIDFAPTFLEIAGLDTKKAGMQSITGRSLTDIFNSSKSGQVIADRDHVLIGKERHDIGRPYDWGYPIRGIIKNDVLFIRNYEASRWPAGNPETGYLNCDGSPTKTLLLNGRRDSSDTQGYWLQNFGKRPEEEMFRVKSDIYCVDNVADSAGMKRLKVELEKQMVRELTEQGDPRMQGKGHIFDDFQYAHPATRDFYRRHVSGEKLKAGWVEKTDFETGPLD